MTVASRRLLFVIAAVSGLIVTGCGRHAAKVSGSVSFDGQPVTTGVVTFNPVSSGAAAYGPIGTDGRYTIHTGAETGLEPGDYKVTVAANATPEQAAAMGFKVGREGIMPLLTPIRYADTSTTPLTVAVKPGSQVIDLSLERDAPRRPPR